MSKCIAKLKMISLLFLVVINADLFAMQDGKRHLSAPNSDEEVYVEPIRDQQFMNPQPKKRSKFQNGAFSASSGVQKFPMGILEPLVDAQEDCAIGGKAIDYDADDEKDEAVDEESSDDDDLSLASLSLKRTDGRLRPFRRDVRCAE